MEYQTGRAYLSVAVDENHCWYVLCLMEMKALTLTTATDDEPALSNCSDEKLALSGQLEEIDELAGRMGGMDMALNLANQSGGLELLGTYANRFVERFQATGKEVDIDNAISTFELAIGMMSTDHEEYGAYTGHAGSYDFKHFKTSTILIEQFFCWKLRCLSRPRVIPT